MANWFIGDNVASTLNSGIKNPGENIVINNTFISPQVTNSAPPFTNANQYRKCNTSADLRGNTLFGGGTPSSLDFNDNFFYRLYEDDNTQDSNGNNLIYLLVSGPISYGSSDAEQSMLEVSFTVYRG